METTCPTFVTGVGLALDEVRAARRHARDRTDPIVFDRWARHGDSAFVMLFDSGTEKTLVVQFQRLTFGADTRRESR